MYKGETACVVVISRRVAGGVWALTRSGRRMAFGFLSRIVRPLGRLSFGALYPFLRAAIWRALSLERLIDRAPQIYPPHAHSLTYG